MKNGIVGFISYMSEVQLAIGFAGLVCSLFYRIPQIWKMYRTESAKDISLWMIHIQNVSYVFYTIYGFMIDDIVYIVSSFLSVIQNIIIIAMYLYFTRRAEPAENSANNPVEVVSQK